MPPRGAGFYCFGFPELIQSKPAMSSHPNIHIPAIVAGFTVKGFFWFMFRHTLLRVQGNAQSKIRSDPVNVSILAAFYIAEWTGDHHLVNVEKS
jgi:hypothetical protein